MTKKIKIKFSKTKLKNNLLFDVEFSLYEFVLFSFELTLLLLRRKRRGDAELDWTDEPVEYESQLCFRFLCAKSMSRFIASGLFCGC